MLASVYPPADPELQAEANTPHRKHRSSSIEFNKGLIETRLSGQEFTALVAAWQQQAFSEDVLWANLQRGKVAPMERTLEEDRELRAEEGGGVRFQPVAAPEGDGEPEEPAEPGESAA